MVHLPFFYVGYFYISAKDGTLQAQVGFALAKWLSPLAVCLPLNLLA
jgi:hypothetical protein